MANSTISKRFEFRRQCNIAEAVPSDDNSDEALVVMENNRLGASTLLRPNNAYLRRIFYIPPDRLDILVRFRILSSRMLRKERRLGWTCLELSISSHRH